MEIVWKAAVAIAAFAGIVWWFRKLADLLDGQSDRIKELEERVSFLEDRLADMSSRQRHHHH